MEGVTTALVVFIFAALLYPKAIKNKTQFYAAFVAVVFIILVFSLDVMIRSPGFQVFGGAVTGLLQLFALIMLFLAAGGMSIGELTEDLRNAYEVVRRGEERKTVIIPLGERPVDHSRTGDIPAEKVEQPSPAPAREPEQAIGTILPLEGERDKQ